MYFFSTFPLLSFSSIAEIVTVSAWCTELLSRSGLGSVADRIRLPLMHKIYALYCLSLGALFTKYPRDWRKSLGEYTATLFTSLSYPV